MLSKGSFFQGRYEVLELLGEGGMGAVYKVRQIDAADRIIALKLLHSISIDDDESVKRFQQEAKALAKLQHANIVNFFHFGLSENGLPYAALEYLPGKDLSFLLKLEGGLPLPRCLKIMKQVLQALSYAHAEGVVHRDLKPGNIIVIDEPETDTVKLVDFGLAKLLDAECQNEKLTGTGLLIGSIHYMSPEQAAGKPVDQRSDIYSCGCILFEMLCGEKPFDADSPVGMLYKHQNEQAPAFKDTPSGKNRPQGLERICSKAMQKKAENRYQNAHEFLRDLELVESGEIAELSAPALKANWRRLRPGALYSLLAVFLLVVAAVGAFAIVNLQKQSVLNEKRKSEEEKRKKQLYREIQVRKRNLEQARAELSKAQDDLSKKEATATLCFHLCWLGRIATEAGDFALAKKCLDESLPLSGEAGEAGEQHKVRALILRARCFMKNGELDKSRQDFVEALSCTEKYWGKGRIEWQDVLMQYLTLKARVHAYEQVAKDLSVLRELWERQGSSNPKTFTGHYQSITRGGPTRLELLYETLDELSLPNSATREGGKRLDAILSLAETFELSRDRKGVSKCVKLAQKLFPELVSRNPEIRNKISELNQYLDGDVRSN